MWDRPLYSMMGIAILGLAEEDGADVGGMTGGRLWCGLRSRGWNLWWRLTRGHCRGRWLSVSRYFDWLLWLLWSNWCSLVCTTISCHTGPFVESQNLSIKTFTLMLRVYWVSQVLQYLA